MNWNSYITSKSFLIVVIVLQTFNRWSIIIPWIKFQWLQIFCNIEQDSWKPKKKCQNFYITLYPHCQFFVLIVTSKINFLEFNFNNLWQRIFSHLISGASCSFQSLLFVLLLQETSYETTALSFVISWAPDGTKKVSKMTLK